MLEQELNVLKQVIDASVTKGLWQNTETVVNIHIAFSKIKEALNQPPKEENVNTNTDNAKA